MAVLTVSVARWKFGGWPKFGYAILSAIIATFLLTKVSPILTGILGLSLSTNGATAEIAYPIIAILIMHFVVMILVNRLLVTSPQETSLTVAGSFQVTLAQSVYVFAFTIILMQAIAGSA